MQKKGFFITATDTDAGKTFITSRLVKMLRAQNYQAVGLKPMCCGTREDAEILERANDHTLSLDEVNPCWFPTAAAPHVAAQFSTQSIDFTSLLDYIAQMQQQHDVLCVEGVGGWMVPLDGKDYTLADFAKQLALPILLVVGNRVGAINHTWLTLLAMKQEGIKPAGIIMNSLQEEQDVACITNRAILEEFFDVPVLTNVIWQQEQLDFADFQHLFAND